MSRVRTFEQPEGVATIRSAHMRDRLLEAREARLRLLRVVGGPLVRDRHERIDHRLRHLRIV